MSDNESYVFGKMFSAIKYKALDYVCEETTRLKVTMNLLALPMPYHPGEGLLYPHAGTLSYVTYRTPWIRGNVISTCKLLVSGSVLQELGSMAPANACLERLSVTVHHLKGDSEDVVPSSNPDSNNLERDEAFWLLENTKSNGDLCQESFCNSIANKMCSRQDNDDLLLPEDIMFVDYLTQCKRHACMPTTKATLSRLRTLPVSDPLLSSTGAKLSEDIIFRHCAPYESPPHLDGKNSHTCSPVKEEFEPLTTDESLLLPVELDTLTLKTNIFNHFKDLCCVVNVAPEPNVEQSSVLDMLHKVSPSLTLLEGEISQFEVLTGATTDCMMHEDQLDPQSTGHLLLPTDLELNVTLTPTPKSRLTQLWLSASQLPVEPLSSVYRNYLVSDGKREEMELALWKAEKHQTNVLGFLLAEPWLQEVAVEFHPLIEAISTSKFGELSSFSIGDKMDLRTQILTGDPGMRLTNSADFPETMMTSLCPHTEGDKVEDFTTLTSQQIEYILRVFEEDSTASVPVMEVKVRSILKNTSHPAIPSQMELSGTSASISGVHVFTCSSSIQTEACVEASPNSFSARAGTPVSSAAASGMERRGVRGGVSALTNSYSSFGSTTGNTGRPKSKDNSKQEQDGASTPFISSDGDDRAIHLVSKRPPKKDVDPLSTFMMLRSQQSYSVTVFPQHYTYTPVPHAEPQTTSTAQPEQKPALDVRPAYMSGVVTGIATRVSPSSSQQDKQDSRVVQVQAKASQWCAYCELLAFARPCLSRAKELGLSYRGDFSSLDPEQTRFLLKQQEKELSRAPQAHDQEVLFSQVALIHVLVMVKDVLLNCDLNTALEYLPKVAEACAGQRVDQLLRRLQVLLYLSQRNQEPCPKLLELQEQLAVWLRNNGDRQNPQGKVLVMTAVDSDRVRNMLINGLSQVTGDSVIALCPDEGKMKLNGARVINSMRGSVCAVACSQQMAADFPWQCFSLVVEYHHSGHSPWAALCRERSTSHLVFHTVLPSADETASWSLEEKIPYVLLVTEGLLNCPLLLQTLESTYNMTVLERSHCQSLQMLGGTHHYAVITVDEGTVIIIQEQAELCQDRACESMVMRLTALSLQYRCCWLILRFTGCQGEGLTSQGFSNLVLVYSSLVLFGMKTEDLDVKVLMASEAEDIARWISKICFHSLMAGSDDPVRYLDRSWLTVIPSEEETCLSGFPCLNPLVSQLMLRRAPSLQWLLGASLAQLEELLPEAPHKVLKLFSDTTSLYKLTTDPSPPQSHNNDTFTQKQPTPPGSPWTTSRAPQHALCDPQPEQFTSSHTATFLPSYPGAEGSIKGSFCDPEAGTADTQGAAGSHFHVDLSGSEALHSQSHWSISPWKDREREASFSGWEGAAVGNVIERGALRAGEEWMRRSPRPNQDLYNSTSPPDSGPFNHHLYNTTSPPDVGPFHQDLYPTSTSTPSDSSPFKEPLDSPFSYTISPQQPAYCNTSYSSQQQHPESLYRCDGLTSPRQTENLYRCDGLTSPRQTVAWGEGEGGGDSLYQGTARISPDYGTKYWMGQETRKRSGEAAGMVAPVLTPLKRAKLSYERVPGRIDGQTRLKFF